MAHAMVVRQVSLSCAFRSSSAMVIPSKSSTSFSSFLRGLPRFLFPSTIPERMSFPKPLLLATWPIKDNFLLLMLFMRVAWPILSRTHSFFPFSPTYTHNSSVTPYLEGRQSVPVTFLEDPTFTSVSCYREY